MKRSIGKNTLGGGSKMNVDMRTYNRSTHNLSYAWRSSMGVGTLVPFMCEVGLAGDTWDINLQEKILTHPTVGPLFGTYKLQLDVFTCPIRLYNAMLHNNKLNVGLDMAKVKLPQLEVSITENELPTKENKWSQINPSCVLAYLGRRGYSGKKETVNINATSLIGYWDIWKNYYANKQEEKGYYIGNEYQFYEKPKFEDRFEYESINGNVVGGTLVIILNSQEDAELLQKNMPECYLNFGTRKAKISTLGENAYWGWAPSQTTSEFYMVLKVENQSILTDGNKLVSFDWYTEQPSVVEFKIETIDNLREDILSAGTNQFKINALSFAKYPFIANLITPDSKGYRKSKKPLAGLALKTLQSDIFNNWINTEWLDGDNGINAITSISTSGGSFTIDTLNLSKKVYDMLNRIAVSGGTYKDWIETVYSVDYNWHPETPVYEGGLSAEIEFGEVISTAATANEELGTIAGRGYSSGRKGGNIHIKLKEHCYIIGIVSITPRVDYCQGNRFDTDFKTMDDFHKPALDGIGFQDLTLNKMAWWKPNTESIGKQPAWIDYMTNFNRTFGNFAIEDNESFMVLNRLYYTDDADFVNGELNTTTYINPKDYTYTFASNTVDGQDFWVQIGCGIKCRRVMSAKQIPNL